MRQVEGPIDRFVVSELSAKRLKSQPDSQVHRRVTAHLIRLTPAVHVRLTLSTVKQLALNSAAVVKLISEPGCRRHTHQGDSRVGRAVQAPSWRHNPRVSTFQHKPPSCLIISTTNNFCCTWAALQGQLCWNRCCGCNPCTVLT